MSFQLNQVVYTEDGYGVVQGLPQTNQNSYFVHLLSGLKKEIQVV